MIDGVMMGDMIERWTNVRVGGICLKNASLNGPYVLC